MGGRGRETGDGMLGGKGALNRARVSCEGRLTSTVSRGNVLPGIYYLSFTEIHLVFEDL